MSADESAELERAWNQWVNSDEYMGKCSLAIGSYVDFHTMQQLTPCGDVRSVRRLSREQYQELKNQYTDYFNRKEYVWCLDCRSRYLLYSPQFQQIINDAYEMGKAVTIRLTECYDYTIDPFHGIQRNNQTGTTRHIRLIKIGTQTKPIHGSFMFKVTAVAPSVGDHSEPTASAAIEDNSCIYGTGASTADATDDSTMTWPARLRRLVDI